MSSPPQWNEIRRWESAHSETQRLLRMTDRLMSERTELFRQRAELIRDLASAAFDFVESAREKRQRD